MARDDQPGHLDVIDLEDDEAVHRWAQQLGVSDQRLRELVDIAGPTADHVALYLLRERGLVKDDPTPDS
jgi:hypothetical protein